MATRMNIIGLFCHPCYRLALNVMVEWLPHLLHTLDVPGSNLGPEAGYPDWDFRGFPLSLQANARMVP
jgi:hypothetical protein